MRFLVYICQARSAVSGTKTIDITSQDFTADRKVQRKVGRVS